MSYFIFIINNLIIHLLQKNTLKSKKYNFKNNPDEPLLEEELPSKKYLIKKTEVYNDFKIEDDFMNLKRYKTNNLDNEESEITYYR